MKREDVQYGQRIRVNLPGIGDHGHVGTVKQVRGSLCSVHLDRDQHPHHVVVLYAADLDLIPNEPRVGMPARETVPMRANADRGERRVESSQAD